MITALLVIAVVGIVGFGVALSVSSKRQFSEQNQIVPGTKSPAPASWAGAHSREAKLHRRLGDAVKGAHENPKFVELGLGAQMKSIEAEALAIDERLVAAAGLSAAHKDAAIDPLETNVAELESTIADMVMGVSVADSKELLQQAVSAADIRLQALAQARAEVEQVDRTASGLIDPVPDETADEADQSGEPGPAKG